VSGPVEPSADKRQAAHELREIYVALLAEGFTERESVAIIGQILAAGGAA
jgi:hypothetical protein